MVLEHKGSTEHPPFTLFHYLSFAKFVAMLQTSTLWFTRWGIRRTPDILPLIHNSIIINHLSEVSLRRAPTSPHFFTNTITWLAGWRFSRPA